jgi:predicted RND superfamily exporter protein
MTFLARLIVRYPRLIIAITLVITALAVAVSVSRGVKFNLSFDTLAEHDSNFQFYQEIRRTFGDDRVIIVGLTTREVFDADFLSRLGRLTSRLAAVRGVEEVQSITNVKSARRTGDGVVIDRLIPLQPTDSQLIEIRATATRDPLYAGNLVSRDGRTAAINVFMNPKDEVESRSLADQIERIARSEAGGDELLLAGVPVMDARGIRNMVRDFVITSPIAALLCFLVFLASFRTFWSALLPLVSLAIGLVWLIGLMAVLARPITIATVSLPTVLIAVGGSYMFHVINQHRISTAGASPAERRAAWLAGLRFIYPAVAVSGFTVMAGFGALYVSAIPSVKDMGLLNAIGVFFMLVLALLFVPAALTVAPGATRLSAATNGDYAQSLNRFLQFVTALVLYRRRAILIVVAVVTVSHAAGILLLRVNTDYLSLFPRSSDTVQSAIKLHERLSGAAVVQVVVGGPPGAVYDPEFLGQVQDLERFALTNRGVDAAISVADIVSRIGSMVYGSQGIAAHDPGGIPGKREQIESLFRDFLSGEPSLSRLVSSTNGRSPSQAIIVLRTHLYGSTELAELERAIDDWARGHLQPGIDYRLTGSVVLLNGASDALARSQGLSFAVALTAIYFMMAALFRSLLTAAIALAPNLVPIIGYFGFLGWTGIPLDITTSLIATAALGLAVDNAVHVIRRYHVCSADAKDEGWAMWLTMLQTGKPMMLANLMLIAAFLIFMLSSFVPVRIGGLLWAFTITACLVSNLVFLPILISRRASRRRIETE